MFSNKQIFTKFICCFRMVQLVTIVAVVTSACSVFGSVSHVPAQDQYKTRGAEDEQEQQPHQQLRSGSKATDYQFPNVHLPHRFGPFLKKMTQDHHKISQSFVPELQVGCGEGFTEPKKWKGRRKREAEGKNRFFYTPPLRSYSLYKPQAYQIQKPYYIPVWGAPGKVPIYFPPQPILLNPGYPRDNPRGSYLPPKGYLPPAKPSKPDLSDRFMDSDDDAPIWDTESVEAITQKPSTTTQIVPTRRTKRPGQRTTFPPLVHNEMDRNDTFNNLAANPPPPSRTTTTTTTVPPPAQAAPSRCVWAIVSCCAASSADVSYACFEQLGCSGAFWDNSPCDSEFARAAIDSAMKYYDSSR